MKWVLVLLFFVFELHFATAQISRKNGFLGQQAQDLVYDRAKIYLDEQFYQINGMKVIGTPFLYKEWYDGTVITSDGRVFTGYQLKYNAYSQVVLFFNGVDSLEVTDPIKEFTLHVEDSNHINTFRFVNANQFNHQKENFFYEVVADSSAGMLLRTDRKIISEGHNGLPVFEGKKTFSLEVEYYFYNKQTKQLDRIKGNGSNISSLLGLSKEEEGQLGLRMIDFNNEAELLNFFNNFFAIRKPIVKTF